MRKISFATAAVILGVLIGATLSDGGRTVKLVAQAAFMRGMASGVTRGWAVPAYLKSCNYSATTASNNCHAGPTVLGCVVINTAGAASSTIKIYNQLAGNVIAAVLHETIDATQVGRQFCYGKLLTGGLTVAIASGGTAPDVTITYQGQ